MELSADEAGLLLGISEDEVLVRQGRGELPARLSWTAAAADAADAPEESGHPGGRRAPDRPPG